MKSPLGTQNLGQGTGPGSALGMAPGSGIFQVMEAAVLDLAAPWGKETFKVNLILYDKDRALCSALETAVWVRRDCYCYCCYKSCCYVAATATACLTVIAAVTVTVTIAAAALTATIPGESLE
jgi:hypothetical protein